MRLNYSFVQWKCDRLVSCRTLCRQAVPLLIRAQTTLYLPGTMGGIWIVRTIPLSPFCFDITSVGDLADSGFTDLTGVNKGVRNQSFEHNVTIMDDERMWALVRCPFANPHPDLIIPMKVQVPVRTGTPCS